MHLPTQLAQAHSRANADRVLQHVLANPAALPDLLDVFFTAETRLVQRAAMVVGDLGRVQPTWLVPYHARLIVYAADPDSHAAVTRNVTRYFSELPLAEVGEADEGPLLDLAFSKFEDGTVPVGIRVFCMQIVYHFSERYPELRDELREVIERELAEGEVTAGFRSRGRKVLRALGVGR